MTVSDLDRRWLEVNDAYCRMLGYSRAELLKNSWRDVTHPDDQAEDETFIAGAIDGGIETLERDKRYVRRDGTVIWAHVRVELVRDRDGSPVFFVSHTTDATQRRATQHLLSDSERTLRAVIDNTPAMISVKDRDYRYKLVNREFEQHFGVDSSWIVGRSDADVLAPSTLEAVHARDLAVLNDGVRTQEEEMVEIGGRDRRMLLTRFPLRDEDGEIHGVCTASTDITARRLEERDKQERVKWTELIYSALAHDRLVLYGQPIVPLVPQQPQMHELLIRARSPDGRDELLAPATFLPGAERFDLIAPIDEWVVKRAVELAAAGRRVTVNVSAKTISDTRRVQRIEAAVIAGGAPAANLVFEVTETAVAGNLDAAHKFAVQMRGLGSAIALDDFGVGHGSFTYLRHLPVDYLKIDMQFVRNLMASRDDLQVVQAIIGVARQFRIQTIAEGVEDEATLDELRRLGVDYGQGHWLGSPAPLPEGWLSSRPRS
jgi:PAS domain S-box-containing protein